MNCGGPTHPPSATRTFCFLSNPLFGFFLSSIGFISSLCQFIFSNSLIIQEKKSHKRITAHAIIELALATFGTKCTVIANFYNLCVRATSHPVYTCKFILISVLSYCLFLHHIKSVMIRNIPIENTICPTLYTKTPS